ncbi:MAG: arsenate reductase ArsC [Bacteriovoracaceae bacterium]|jgi:arsenate reductase (thioredoxin)|nr:arsenate reductase ArsC [Bacteriovoracaceae bacterium]
MISILVLCTGNSCRSQMAEAILRGMDFSDVSIYSAGIEKHGLNPWAMKVIEEIDLDINVLSSKTLDEFKSEIEFDYVLTVCKNAHESCPVFQGSAEIIHHSFEDPPFLARGIKDEEKILAIYREVRNTISEYLHHDFIKRLPLK